MKNFQFFIAEISSWLSVYCYRGMVALPGVREVCLDPIFQLLYEQCAFEHNLLFRLQITR